MIFTLLTPKWVIAQNLSSSSRQKSLIADKIPQNSGQCRRLTDEEIERISKNIQDLLFTQFIQETENLPQTQPKFNERFIFSDDIRVQILLDKKYKAYENILYGQNWKESPYGNLDSKEINNEVNALTSAIYKELKQNPFYKSDRFGSNCGEAGMILVDLAIFVGLTDIVGAALPATTTVAGYSALSGFAWDFSTLFNSPPFLIATTKFGRIGSTLTGFITSASLLDKLHNFIRTSILDFPDEEKTALGTQKDLHIALKHNFDLDKEIKKIQKDTNLNLEQKQKRIETRYKEAIIKIYALDYVKTYLVYAEKPEKYFWALLDLTTLLQNRDFVNFGDFERAEIKIEHLPRLVKRTPEMQATLQTLTSIYIQGYKIQKHADNMQKRVEKQAIKNVENADISFDLDF